MAKKIISLRNMLFHINEYIPGALKEYGYEAHEVPDMKRFARLILQEFVDASGVDMEFSKDRYDQLINAIIKVVKMIDKEIENKLYESDRIFEECAKDLYHDKTPVKYMRGFLIIIDKDLPYLGQVDHALRVVKFKHAPSRLLYYHEEGHIIVHELHRENNYPLSLGEIIVETYARMMTGFSFMESLRLAREWFESVKNKYNPSTLGIIDMNLSKIRSEVLDLIKNRR